MYLSLFAQGWKMKEVDDIDLLYYIDLLIYQAEKEQEKAKQELIKHLGF